MGYIIDFIVIILAVGVWEVAYDHYKRWRDRDIANLLCDFCGKPRKTRKTKDKYYWGCRTCKKLYDGGLDA